MATVTNQELSAYDDALRYYCSYDDVSLNIISLRIENDTPWSLYLRARRPNGQIAAEVTSDPGGRDTYNVPGNLRSVFPTYAIEIGPV